MKRIETTIPDVAVIVVDHPADQGVHGIRVFMGHKVKRDISDMLDDATIEALTQEVAESEDPLGIDIDTDYNPNEEGDR